MQTQTAAGGKPKSEEGAFNLIGASSFSFLKLQRISRFGYTTKRNQGRGLLSLFISTFQSLPPSNFAAPGSVGGSASLQRGRSAELQITRCTPKHLQAQPEEPLRRPSSDRENRRLE